MCVSLGGRVNDAYHIPRFSKVEKFLHSFSLNLRERREEDNDDMFLGVLFNLFCIFSGLL